MEHRQIVVIDPRTGLHLRQANGQEREAYLAVRHPTRVGEVLVDEYKGPGIWFGGAGF